LNLPKQVRIIEPTEAEIKTKKEQDTQYNDSIVDALMGENTTIRFKPVEPKKSLRPQFSVPIKTIFSPAFLENAENALRLNRKNSTPLDTGKTSHTIINMEDMRFKASG